MRELTFKSYLKTYLKEMSQNKTLDISVLAKEASSGFEELYVPLGLYCNMCEKMSALNKAVARIPGFDVSTIPGCGTITERDLASKRNIPGVSEEYRKIYQDYLVVKTSSKISHEYKESLRKEILAMNKRLGIPMRRLGLYAGVDTSNLNAFMKDKQYSKVTAEKLNMIIDYLKEKVS